MGNPYEWYKTALEYLARMLSDRSRRLTTFESMSKEDLETYITERRSQISEKAFYYCAGVAAANMCADAGDAGCDAMNAAICGLAQFEDFIDFDYHEVMPDE